MNKSATILYSNTHSNGGYYLMEMTEDMLAELQACGQFIIKGEESEEAVLCTKNASFTVKEAPSSNSLLLLDTVPFSSNNSDNTDKIIIESTLGSVWQLHRTAVKMEQLKKLIFASPLEPRFLSQMKSKSIQDVEENLYSIKDLENVIQSSLVEIEAALKQIGAFEFLGFYRVLSADFELSVAKELVYTIISLGLDPSNLYLKDLKSNFSGDFPSEIVEHVISLYTSPKDSDNNDIVSLNIKKYNSIVARSLLSQRHEWLLSEFLVAWKSKLPDFFVPELSSLDGMVCLQEYGKDSKLSFLPSWEMSYNPKLRLAELFKAKPKWTFNEIKPYLQDLINQDMNEEQILVAFTRSSNGPNGTKLYSSR